MPINKLYGTFMYLQDLLMCEFIKGVLLNFYILNEYTCYFYCIE